MSAIAVSILTTTAELASAALSRACSSVRLNRPRGVRRSWAMSVETWRRPFTSPFYAIEHDIEVSSQPIELVATPLAPSCCRRQPAPEIAGHNPLARTIYRLDSAQHTGAHRHATEHRQHERGGSPPSERLHHEFAKVVEGMSVLSQNEKTPIGQGDPKCAKQPRFVIVIARGFVWEAPPIRTFPRAATEEKAGCRPESCPTDLAAGSSEDALAS